MLDTYQGHSVHRFSLIMGLRFSRLSIQKGVYVLIFFSVLLSGHDTHQVYMMQDDTRLWRTAAEKHVWKSTGKDMSTYFCAINRNKLSMTLNLKQEKGREILFRLVKEADVVSVVLHLEVKPSVLNYHRVENFVPGKMDEMGIGYEKLREINPSIIYASVSGQSSIIVKAYATLEL